MKQIFNSVYEFLIFISSISGLNYKEVNIIIWFIIIPFSWCFLIDKIINKHYLKIIFSSIVIFTLLFINDFSEFSNSLFDKSANFLKTFDNIGSNYTTSSVIICVLIPILIYFILIKKAYFQKIK